MWEVNEEAFISRVGRGLEASGSRKLTGGGCSGELAEAVGIDMSGTEGRIISAARKRERTCASSSPSNRTTTWGEVTPHGEKDAGPGGLSGCHDS